LGVELILDDAMSDLIADGIDVAVRGGRLSDSSLIAKRLVPLRLVVCAATEYWQKRGLPKDPRQLVQHEWITYTPLGVPQRLTFRGPRGRVVVRPKGRVATNNGAVIRDLLRAGHGVALLPDFWVADDLDSGRLRAVLEGHELAQTAVHAVYPAARYVPAKVRAFVDYLATST
jgi:DNA-binding transcriptional LysR family regulator